LYSKLFIRVGIVGLVIFLLLNALILNKAIKRSKSDVVFGVFLIIMLSLATGMGMGSFMTPRLSEIIAFVMAFGLFLLWGKKQGDDKIEKPVIRN